MKSNRAFYYAIHVLGQLTRKSELYRRELEALPASSNIEDWPLEAWQEFSEAFLKNPEGKPFEGLTKKSEFSKILYHTLQITLESESRVITLVDDEYPELLKQTSHRPLALFCKGNLKLLQTKLVSIIGSRRTSLIALDKSYEVAYALVRNRVSVVSGGAFGCDSLAHRGALRGASPSASTIVVFSGGLGQLYPKANFRLFEEVLEKQGLLLSERLFHQSSLPHDFPIRNRIISGLCQSTLVMDAGLKSGSMVTANLALDQGRNVFVLKPSSVDELSPGVQSLVEAGAERFGNEKDILQYLEAGEL